MQSQTYTNISEEDLPNIAADYAAIWQRPGTVIALHGDLGAGKTALVRQILRAWMGDKNMPVPSPTFTILQEYELPNIPAYHYDLYRMTDTSELQELNWHEAVRGGVVFVEWPDRAGGTLGRHWKIHIMDGDAQNQRTIRIEAPQ